MPRLLPLARPVSSRFLNCRTAGTARNSLKFTQRKLVTAAAQGEPSSKPPQVCVVGGGFGGLYTALRLESLIWPRGQKPEITVIDRNDRFVFKPLLYELLNGAAQPWEVAPPLSQLLAPYPIRFIQGSVSSVSLEVPEEDGSLSTGRVLLEGGAAVEYDYLVLGMGSGSDPRGVPGVRDLAYAFNNFDDAMKVNQCLERLRSVGSDCRIMVVGAGYSGVELSMAVAEAMGPAALVQVVTPAASILDSSAPGAREAAARALGAAGVSILTGAKVLEVKQQATSNGTVPLSEGACTVVLEVQAPAVGEPSVQEVNVDMVLWTAGSSAALKTEQLRSKFPFPITAAGAVEVEPTLRVVGHDRVFAVGDIASVRGEGGSAGPGAWAPTAQVAFQQADYAAWNIWASINNRALLPFRYQHLGTAMALGGTNAAMVLPVSLPPPLRSTLEASPLGPLLQAVGLRLGGSDPQSDVTVEGPLAALLRRAAYLYRQPTSEHRTSVAVSWLQQAATSAAGMSQNVLETVLAGRK